MFSSISSINSIATKATKYESIIDVPQLSYDYSNQYTDPDSQVWTNYVFLSGTNKTAINFSHYTGTVCVLAIGGGGSGGLGGSSGATAGSASQIVLAKYTLSNFSDSVKITVAPTTGSVGITGLNVGQTCGANSTVTFSSHSAFNLTSIGGAGGSSNANGQNGGCSGNAGRSNNALTGGLCTANYYDVNNSGQGVTTNIGTNSLYAIGFGSAEGKSVWNSGYGWGGNGCGGMATNPGTIMNASCGGAGMQIPPGYGISKYYWYCGGGGGSHNASGFVGGIAYAGGGCGGGNSLTSVLRDGSTPTGYGAIDDLGTSGVLVSSAAQNPRQNHSYTGSYLIPGNGVLGSGGGSGANLFDANTGTIPIAGLGGSGIIIISVKN